MQFKIYVIPIVLASILVVDSFFVLSFKDENVSDALLSKKASDTIAQAYILPISEPNYLPILNSNVEQPFIDAKSAIVYDFQSSKILYQKNINEQLPIASLTKILSAMVVLDNFDLDEVVTVRDTSIRVDGEKQDLYIDEKITVENLLKLMIIQSSNDAAYALADHAEMLGLDFIERMNYKARSLRMVNSLFLDPAGLNDLAYSTASDLVKLIRVSFYYDHIWGISLENDIIVESTNGGVQHNLINTNKLLAEMPNIGGGKTGYTDAALGCMILLFNIPEYQGDIVSIVVGSNDRFGDTVSLFNWIKSSYIWK
jgi:serine-type D-Ala-D-Ala carboxypeptidase (penicillin-binding protein 5/6)